MAKGKANTTPQSVYTGVRVFERPHTEEETRYIYEANIVLEGGEQHNGVGETPARALLYAAEHWFRMTEGED